MGSCLESNESTRSSYAFSIVRRSSSLSRELPSLTCLSFGTLHFGVFTVSVSLDFTDPFYFHFVSTTKQIHLGTSAEFST